MDLTIFTLMTIIAAVIIVWTLIKIVEKIFNIKALVYASRNPDVTKQKHGIVYNKKTKRLEADQSPITPF